ncbi:hypothetical protein BKA65DRAFT_556447 [Rhexocercosporidium sp. MPI-PUGE-AT-0058]|nr:hypothetical protein BKA65DRAFT_556447 [Rhexocercosporidium sp. MPI-PUGE-AT-0058]
MSKNEGTTHFESKVPQASFLAQKTLHNPPSPTIGKQNIVSKTKHLNRRQTKALRQKAIEQEQAAQAKVTPKDTAVDIQLTAQYDSSSEQEETDDEQRRRDEQAAKKRARRAAHKAAKKQYRYSYDGPQRKNRQNRVDRAYSTRPNTGPSHRSSGPVRARDLPDGARTLIPDQTLTSFNKVGSQIITDGPEDLTTILEGAWAGKATDSKVSAAEKRQVWTGIGDVIAQYCTLRSTSHNREVLGY